MPLINIVIALIVVGVALWLINNFIPMAGSIKTILNVVVVVAVAIWVLQAVGMWGRVTSYQVYDEALAVTMRPSILVIGIFLAIPVTGLAQPFVALEVNDKLASTSSSRLVRWRSSAMRRTPESSRRPIPRRNGDRAGPVTESVRRRPSPAPGSKRSGFWFGFDPARGSALFPFRRRRVLAPNGTCVPRHHSHAHGPGNRDAVSSGVSAAHTERPIYRTSGIRAG